MPSSSGGKRRRRRRRERMIGSCFADASTFAASRRFFVLFFIVGTVVLCFERCSVANGYIYRSSNNNIINYAGPKLTKAPSRELEAPFPNGVAGGRLVTIPSSEHYDVFNKRQGILGGGEKVLPSRDIEVWLPADYDLLSPKTKFPVLYCHDGQNAIDDSTSWTGYSWRLAGCLQRMSEHKLLKTGGGGVAQRRGDCSSSPPIVVLMPCAEDRAFWNVVPRRHLEYGDTSQIWAQAHADFVAQTLKPLIDTTFRTLPGPEHTAAIGSSLGGQASMNLLLRHPRTFGKIACLSPAFQPSILASVATTPSLSKVLEGKTIYIDNGGDEEEDDTKEGGKTSTTTKVALFDPLDHMTSNHWWNPGYWWLDSQLQPGVDAMRFALKARGVPYHYSKFPGGRHNERGWSVRIHHPLLALYG